MQRIASGLIGVDHGIVALFSDFESGGEMWSGKGPRERRTPVVFAIPFRTPPAVHLSLNMFDMDNQHNQRLDLSAEEVTEEGFEIVFRTWADTRVARARASWMAVGELHEEPGWDIP